VNRHATRYTSPVSVVPQHKLVSKKRTSAPPYGPTCYFLLGFMLALKARLWAMGNRHHASNMVWPNSWAYYTSGARAGSKVCGSDRRRQTPLTAVRLYTRVSRRRLEQVYFWPRRRRRGAVCRQARTSLCCIVWWTHARQTRLFLLKRELHFPPLMRICFHNVMKTYRLKKKRTRQTRDRIIIIITSTN